MMKLKWMIAAGAMLLACGANAEEALILKTRNEKESYTRGVNIVRNLMQQGGEISKPAFD